MKPTDTISFVDFVATLDAMDADNQSNARAKWKWLADSKRESDGITRAGEPVGLLAEDDHG
jgi:hypothetical protein